MSVSPPPVAATPEDDICDSVRAAAQLKTRKKDTGVREWLFLYSSGQAQNIEVSKQVIMRRTGLSAHYLRIVDPILSYPYTVLGRERAIVINIEHVKAIITAQEVMLLNSKDASLTPFVNELQRRILRYHHATSMEQRVDGDAESTHLYNLGDPRSREGSPTRVTANIPESGHEVKADGKHYFDRRDGPKLLPFEFVALDACLEAACGSLDNAVGTLEEEAHSALDKLTSKISTVNLDLVSKFKRRLVDITGCVQKVRDELEQLLNDDGDMAKMYLTDKLEQQLDSSSSVNVENVMDKTAMDDRVPADGFMDGNTNLHEREIQQIDSESEHLFRANTLGRESRGTRTSTTWCGNSKRELEMLLEAYFVQVDGALRKVSTLRKYVDHAEDYNNIMLDDKQNHLLDMDVKMALAGLAMSLFGVVAGVFGMNIYIDLFKDKSLAQEEAGNRRFLWTVGVGTFGTIFLYFIVILWCKTKRLLE